MPVFWDYLFIFIFWKCSSLVCKCPNKITLVHRKCAVRIHTCIYCASLSWSHWLFYTFVIMTDVSWQILKLVFFFLWLLCVKLRKRSTICWYFTVYENKKHQVSHVFVLYCVSKLITGLLIYYVLLLNKCLNVYSFVRKMRWWWFELRERMLTRLQPRVEWSNHCTSQTEYHLISLW